MWQCHYCQITLSAEIQKKNRLCPNCASELHCCRNCVHFDEKLSNKCQEPNTEWFSDRSALNDCHFFEFRKATPAPTATTQQTTDATTEAERAKEAFRALFRDPRSA